MQYNDCERKTANRPCCRRVNCSDLLGKGIGYGDKNVAASKPNFARRLCAVLCRDPTTKRPFGRLVIRSAIRLPGLWLSPLFIGVFGNKSKLLSAQPPPFGLVLRHIQELGFVFRQFRGEWMEHKEVFHAEEVYRSLVET